MTAVILPRRNCVQVVAVRSGAGSTQAVGKICQTVDAATFIHQVTPLRNRPALP